jgi:hypothetical protein
MALSGSWTLKGIEKILDNFFRGATNEPSFWFVVLVTADDVPSRDTENLSELTEIASGNGYTSGGYVLDPNSTDFDVLTINTTAGRVEMRIKDAVWTASGGDIPASGGDARYAVLIGDEGDPIVYAWWDLGQAVSVSDSITLTDLELRGFC